MVRVPDGNHCAEQFAKTRGPIMQRKGVEREKPYDRLTKKYYNKYGSPIAKPRVEISKHQERVLCEDGCDANGLKITEHHTLLVDECELEPAKPWDDDAPPCPVHPRYGMVIKEIQTKFGPAQLRCCPHEECVISCFGDLEERDKFLHTVDRSLHYSYRDPQCTLVCFCNKLLLLKLSKSEKNPDRLFLTCRGRKCKMFQWADDMPHKKVLNHWDWYNSK